MGESDVWILFNAHSSGWYVFRGGLPNNNGQAIGRCQGATSYLINDCQNWSQAKLITGATVIGNNHCNELNTPAPNVTPTPTTTTVQPSFV